MTKEQREEIRSLKMSANSPKSDLLALAATIGDISESQADKLYRIIGQLEAWQNS